ncbi:MAG: trigger factor [Gammaproteobacteria bacterium]|nr:trigger factor [Gammaproteobacteria bacterium]
MQVSVESKEGLERRMTVKLPAEKVDEAVDKRLKEIARNVRLDGFRPGKVPLSVVRRRFSGQIQQEVAGDLIKASYFEALAHESLIPAGEPAIELLEKTDVEGMGYVAVFEVMPEIELQELSTLVISRPMASVTDEDLQNMLEKLRTQRTTWSEVEREAQDGDQVTIDFKGYVDDEAFEGGSADGVPLVLGSGSMIEGFEAGLIGVNSGEDMSLELDFPEDYRAEKLAGKRARFDIKVTKVAEPVLPEIDEEFVKAFGVESGVIEDLHKEIRSNMEHELAEKISAKVKEQAMDGLLDIHSLEVPKALVNQEAEAIRNQTKENMARNGQPSTMELPLNLFEEQAKRRVSLGLLIGEVIKKNDIKVDADRVRGKLEDFARSYEDPQEVINYYYSNKKELESVENMVLEDQVVTWILENAKVEDSQMDFDALMNPPAENTQNAGSKTGLKES